ncbi:class V chitinase CHIT5b-like [Tripterygium wilfordii]|uniref:class V chitinase CHIT5b-like n=1 Tax=Tripterygium wilfordii TaxID=458696 RepID=UPI0018F7FB34|nr:class V chitinase CHIT5b-like [Tripterygium wilfordii]
MAAFSYLHHILIFIIISLMTTRFTTTAAVIGPPPVKAAYWPTWSISYFPPSSIDSTLFTHIYYAFVSPNNVTFKFEDSNSTASLLREFTTTLRGKNPRVKTLISIGGGGDDPNLFARMASNARTREVFIKSAIELAREFEFDGLDLDWEFPQDPKQMMDLGILFKEWRSAIQIEAQMNDRPPLLLTAAVYFSVDFFLSNIYRKYPVDSISRYLDWANPMCYDYHGSWNTSQTGAHAALYDPKSNISTSYGLQSWIEAGVPASKLVMGLPLYGRTWKLKDPNINGIGAPAAGVGPGNRGVLTFLQLDHYNGNNSATVVYDVESVSTYSYVGTSWIGYDDVTSTTTKIGFAKAHGLLGYFFWAVSFDNEGKISKQASRAWTDL